MNELKIFENPEFGKIRTTENSGKFLFCGSDVAKALGYLNPRKALSDHCRYVTKCYAPHPQSSNKQIEMSFIPEGDVYRLIAHSKLPNAEKFESWVFDEVLPSIRKHGAYVTPSTLEQMIADPDTTIQILTALKDERAQRIKLEAEAKKNSPKVLFAESVSATSDCVSVGVLAKMICQNGTPIGQNRLFALLRKDGYLMQSGARYNLPTQKSMEMGLFRIKESTISNPDGGIRLIQTTVVTGRGQEYFINRYSKKEQTKPWGGIFSTQN